MTVGFPGFYPHPLPLPSRGRGVADAAESPSPLRGGVRGGGSPDAHAGDGQTGAVL